MGSTHTKQMFALHMKRLLTPTIVVLVTCLLLVAANILITQHTYSYNSDDVSWQTTLRTWKPFSGQRMYVGAKDNFLVNVPFILFFEHFFKNGRTQLLAEALFFALLNFTLFYLACLYFLKKARIKATYASLSPFLWLASFGSGFITSFLNSNWRDYEFGLTFIFFMLAAKYYYGEIDPYKTTRAKLLTLVTFGVATLFVYSDPYFFYFTLFPIAASFALLSWMGKTSGRKAATAIGFTLLALLAARALTSVVARLGIIAPRGVNEVTTLQTLHKTLDQLVYGLQSIFSVNFSNNFLLALSNILLFGTILAVMVWPWVRTKESRKVALGQEATIRRWIAGLGVLAVLAYIAIGDANEDNSRYLVILAYISTLLVALAMRSFKAATSRALVALILVTTLLNIAASLNQLKNSKASAEAVNSGNYQLIDKLHTLGYTKGYAGYWDGNINTYLSQNAIKFMPVTCKQHTTTIPLPLLINGSLYDQAAAKSFYVVDPTNTSPIMCTQKQVIAQFGKPMGKFKLQNQTVLLYNYDLSTKMPSIL